MSDLLIILEKNRKYCVRKWYRGVQFRTSIDIVLKKHSSLTKLVISRAKPIAVKLTKGSCPYRAVSETIKLPGALRLSAFFSLKG